MISNKDHLRGKKIPQFYLIFLLLMGLIEVSFFVLFILFFSFLFFSLTFFSFLFSLGLCWQAIIAGVPIVFAIEHDPNEPLELRDSLQVYISRERGGKDISIFLVKCR